MNETQKMTEVQRTLVVQNLDLAHHLALAIWRKYPNQDKEEIVAVAYEGLVDAALRFDPSRANLVDDVPDVAGAFAGFARRRINGAILDWQRRRDHVPRRQRAAYKDLQREGHGTGRSPEELSVLTGMPTDRVRTLIAAVEHTTIPLARTVSGSMLEDQGLYGPGEYEMDLASEQGVEEQVLEVRIRETVVEVYDGLSDLQRLVIALRYYEGLDLTAIATTVGVSLTQVRSAHMEALDRLHTAMVHEAS